MASNSGTFSESWFRIAGQRIALRPQVQVRRQHFRGERWHVLHDPFSNQFFRLRPPAWEFVARLSADRTVESVWRERFEEDPENAPGQEEVIRLLAQLYQANLLQSNLAPDSAQLFERYRKRRQRETRAYLLNIMFARIPLLDPDRFLQRLLPLARAAFSWGGAAVWLAVVLGALKVVAERFPELSSQTQGVLAVANLPWLYVALVLIKTVHEFGHAFACRRFGGEVHTMGVMFLLFTPIPYMDATSSWSFRSRWQRALVGAAGMIVEVFVAALAAFVWASTAPGVVNSLAYNMMFIASVSTVLFNANPLLRFDGYYILSDLLDIPNLHQRSAAMVKHWWEKNLYGVTDTHSPARSRREAGWLTAFCLSSNVYRIVVFAAILLFIADRFLILGLLMAVICIVTWILVPLGKFVSYLFTSPRLERTRPRALAVTSGLLALILLVLQMLPWPSRFRAPGVIQARQFTVVVPETGGVIASALAPSGAMVRAGDPLVRLEDPELEMELRAARWQLAESEALELRALRRRSADLEPLTTRTAAIATLLQTLEARRSALTVAAPHDGRWVAPDVPNLVGARVARGTPLGQLINEQEFQFVAIVSQTEASRLFTRDLGPAEVRLRGQGGTSLRVGERMIVPADRQNLPSAALGWRGGGAIATATDDNSGTRAAEPFFEVRAAVLAAEGVPLLQGRSGTIRFHLPPEPLLSQWWRKFLQLLQRRYGI